MENLLYEREIVLVLQCRSCTTHISLFFLTNRIHLFGPETLFFYEWPPRCSKFLPLRYQYYSFVSIHKLGTKCKKDKLSVFGEDDSDRLTFSIRESESTVMISCVRMFSPCFSLFLVVRMRAEVLWSVEFVPNPESTPRTEEGVECDCSHKIVSVLKWIHFESGCTNQRCHTFMILSTIKHFDFNYVFLLQLSTETWYIIAGPVLLCRWRA